MDVNYWETAKISQLITTDDSDKMYSSGEGADAAIEQRVITAPDGEPPISPQYTIISVSSD